MFEWAVTRICVRVEVVRKDYFPFWNVILEHDLHGVTPSLLSQDGNVTVMTYTGHLFSRGNDTEMYRTMSSFLNSLGTA